MNSQQCEKAERSSSSDSVPKTVNEGTYGPVRTIRAAISRTVADGEQKPVRPMHVSKRLLATDVVEAQFRRSQNLNDMLWDAAERDAEAIATECARVVSLCFDFGLARERDYRRRLLGLAGHTGRIKEERRLVLDVYYYLVRVLVPLCTERVVEVGHVNCVPLFAGAARKAQMRISVLSADTSRPRLGRLELLIDDLRRAEKAPGVSAGEVKVTMKMQDLQEIRSCIDEYCTFLDHINVAASSGTSTVNEPGRKSYLM